tara:strand:+ start:52 stop:588 length:537 start_codon:yes stop_codon:yes gene_type:complete
MKQNSENQEEIVSKGTTPVILFFILCFLTNGILIVALFLYGISHFIGWCLKKINFASKNYGRFIYIIIVFPNIIIPLFISIENVDFKIFFLSIISYSLVFICFHLLYLIEYENEKLREGSIQYKLAQKLLSWKYFGGKYFEWKGKRKLAKGKKMLRLYLVLFVFVLIYTAYEILSQFL